MQSLLMQRRSDHAGIHLILMSISIVLFARGLAINGYNPTGFLDILEGMWWTLDRNLTLNDTYLSAMATYIDSIKNGVTTVFDHHASFGLSKVPYLRLREQRRKQGFVPVSVMKFPTEMERTRPESL